MRRRAALARAVSCAALLAAVVVVAPVARAQSSARRHATSARGVLATLGYTLLLSASNKRFLGDLLDLDIGDRREVSLAAVAYGVGRTPLMWTAEAKDLDELSGGRIILGLGNGTAGMMENWHGVDPEAPAARIKRAC